MPRIDDDGTVTTTTNADNTTNDTANTDVNTNPSVITNNNDTTNTDVNASNDVNGNDTTNPDVNASDNDTTDPDVNASDTATNSAVEDTDAEDMQWINPETTKNLIDIAVDILKQTIDNETQTMTSLLGIAVDILTKTIESRKDKGYGFKGFTIPTLEYTLPKASVRLKDIVITTKHVNYYDRTGSPVTPPESDGSDEQSPESNVKTMSRIVPVYDGTNNVKITAYTIEDYENGENGAKIIDELALGDFNLEDFQGENKEKTIEKIINNLKKKYPHVGENLIKEYLGKLGEAIDQLKSTIVDSKKNEETD